MYLGYGILIKHFETAFQDPLFILYVAAVVVDVLLGNIKAWSNNDVNSNIGLRGSLKHVGGFTFVIVLLPPLSYYLNNSGVSIGILTYLVYQYIISIIENLAELGFDVPKVFKVKLTQLSENEKGEKNEDSE